MQHHEKEISAPIMEPAAAISHTHTAQDAPQEDPNELRTAHALLMSHYGELEDKYERLREKFDKLRRDKTDQRAEGHAEGYKQGYNQALDDKGRELDIAEYVDNHIAGEDWDCIIKEAMEAVTWQAMKVETTNAREQLKGSLYLLNVVTQVRYLAAHH